MPKGYWIARIDVHDPETYKKYVEAGRLAYERYNAKFLVRGVNRSRNVVIEFNSIDDARACYNSPEYTAARAFRQAASTGEFILVEGI